MAGAAVALDGGRLWVVAAALWRAGDPGLAASAATRLADSAGDRAVVVFHFLSECLFCTGPEGCYCMPEMIRAGNVEH